jgi:hypothetical protein
MEIGSYEVEWRDEQGVWRPFKTGPTASVAAPAPPNTRTGRSASSRPSEPESTWSKWRMTGNDPRPRAVLDPKTHAFQFSFPLPAIALFRFFTSDPRSCAEKF